MDLYEFNKQIMAQMPACSKAKLDKLKKTINQYFQEHPAKYYMMLNYDKHDFTLFAAFNKENFLDEIADDIYGCFHNRELQIVFIEPDAEGMLEIWCKDEDGTYMYPIFPYDDGIIEYN